MIGCWFGYRFQIINLIKRYSTNKIHVILQSTVFSCAIVAGAVASDLVVLHIDIAQLGMVSKMWSIALRFFISIIGNSCEIGMNVFGLFFWCAQTENVFVEWLFSDHFHSFFLQDIWSLSLSLSSLTYSSSKGYCSRSTKRRKIKTNGFSHRCWFWWKETKKKD